MIKLYPSTKHKICRLYKEGYSKDELYIMYSEYGIHKVNKAIRGFK